MIRWYLLILLVLQSYNASALNWQNFWYTPDQQAQKLMDYGQFDRAESTFENSDWKAAAAFRAKHFEQAAKLYGLKSTADDWYNQGNALAYMNRYQAAIQAYDKALALDAHHQDALYNKKIIEDLLKQNPEESKDNNSEKNKDTPQSNSSSNQKKPDSPMQDNNKDQQDKKENDPSDKNQEPKQAQPSDTSEKSDSNNDKQEAEKTPKQDTAEQTTKDEQAEEKQEESTKSNSDSAQSTPEQQSIKDRWLRLIPDEPGGLIREKLLRDYLRKHGVWRP